MLYKLLLGALALPFLLFDAMGQVPRVSDYQFLYRVDYSLLADDVIPFGDDEIKPIFRNDEKTGTRLLRADIPASGGNKGITVPLKTTKTKSLVKATIMMRGQGSVLPVLRSDEGRTTPAAGVKLGSSWQWVELVARVNEAGESLALDFLFGAPETGDYIEVQRVSLHAAQEQSAREVEVLPRYFSAGDFLHPVGSGRGTGGEVALMTEGFWLKGMPFPRSSKPVTVAVAYESKMADARVALVSSGGRQVLAEKILPAGKGWAFFKEVSASLVGGDFNLCVSPGAGGVSIAKVACSTVKGLDEAAWDAARPVFPGYPTAAVAQKRMPAEREAWLDEALWKSSVTMGDFIRADGNAVAAKTEVRALWDGDMLFLRFDCEEPILRVAEQKLHEFRAEADREDGAVDQDDYAEVMIRIPDDRGAKARFWVNARGVVRDALYKKGESDVKWNAGAVGVGRREEGRWSCVLAIPLKSLGLSGGTQCEVALARKSVARDELSTWNEISSSWVDAPKWGWLEFSTAVPALPALPALSAVVPSQLQVGENWVNVSHFDGGDTENELITQVSLEERGVRREAQTIIARQSHLQTERGVAVELGAHYANKRLRSAWAFLNADLTPLLISRSRTARIHAPMARLKIDVGVRYRLWVNGREIEGGKATAEGVEVPIRKGANELIVWLEKGGAKLELTSDGFSVPCWSFLKGEVADKPVFPKGGEWVRLDAKESLGMRGNAASMLKTTLLWEETRIWPTPLSGIYCAEEAAQHISVALSGAHHGASDWGLFFAVPADFEFVTASGFYARKEARQPRFAWQKVREEIIEGKPHQIIKISSDKRLPRKGELALHPRAESVWAIVRPLRGASEKGGHRIFYWTEADGGTVTEARRGLKVNVLPPLKGVPPNRAIWQLWGPLEQLDEPEASRALLETARLAGFTDFDIGSVDSASGWLGSANVGGRALMRVHFLNGSLFFGPYLTQHKEQRLVKVNGDSDDSRICTSALLAEGWGEAERLLTEQLHRIRPHSVVYDYEYSPLGDSVMHGCYCERCLNAFRDEAKIPMTIPVTSASINRDQAAQWVDFMAKQTTEVFVRLKDSIHRIAPGTLFEVYSGYQTPENPVVYGVDWRYVGDRQAVDRATMGYGRPLKALQDTKIALKGIPLVTGEIINPYSLSDLSPTQPTTSAIQMRRMLDSTGGVLVFEAGSLDGRSWQAVAETSRLVAAYEGLFLEGARSTIPGVDEADGVVLSHGNDTLYCLMNEGGTEKAFSFDLPAHLGTGKEFYTEQDVRKSVTLVIPPGQCRAVHFKSAGR